MAVYEVNLTFINEETSKEFLDWLKSEHIDEMLRLPGFKDGKVLRDTEKPTSLTCVYTLESMEAMQTYLKEYAPKMREPAMKRFAERFSATRRIFSIEHSASSKQWPQVEMEIVVRSAKGYNVPLQPLGFFVEAENLIEFTPRGSVFPRTASGYRGATL